MLPFNIQESAIERHFAVLDRIGCLGDSRTSGYLRPSYSDEETSAMRYIETEGRAIGLTSRWDAVGNLVLETPGQFSEFVEAGSHLDTVPQGGNFDGTAGVIAGLEAIRIVTEAKLPLKRGLRLRVWRGEESGTFNVAYVGSHSAFGKFNPKNLANSFRGKTLAEAIVSQGYDPETIRKQQPTISPSEQDSIAAHIELHIEQGTVLEAARAEIGIVTSIRGPLRFRVEFSGQFDHSGTTPLGTDFRRDANLALAYSIVRLSELIATETRSGKDIIQTFGVINSDPTFNDKTPAVYQNSLSKVSGFGYYYFDIRSAEDEAKLSYAEKAKQLIYEVAQEFNVTAELQQLSSSSGIRSLDKNIQTQLEKSAKELNRKAVYLPSGAGHDAAIVAQQKKTNGANIPVGMIFIPCLDGKSHCPEEFTTYKAIADGASVLAHALASLSSVQQ